LVDILLGRRRIPDAPRNAKRLKTKALGNRREGRPGEPAFLKTAFRSLERLNAK